MIVHRSSALATSFAVMLALASAPTLADHHAQDGGSHGGGHTEPARSPGSSGDHGRAPAAPVPSFHPGNIRSGGTAHESVDHGHWEHQPRWGGGRHGDHDEGPWHGDRDADRFASAGAWRHEWGDGDIRRFQDHDWDDWHQGGWHHEWHGGVFAWWFVVSGVWFWYPVPVYPYPDPYVPATFIVPPPPVAAPASTTQFWYYCPASNGYYPYVPSCASGWQQVPATSDASGPPQGDDQPPPDGQWRRWRRG